MGETIWQRRRPSVGRSVKVLFMVSKGQVRLDRRDGLVFNNVDGSWEEIEMPNKQNEEFDIRVWRKDEKRMFFPNSMVFGTKKDGTHGITAVLENSGRLVNPSVCVLMKPTRKRDKNGRMIWEGDVVYEGCNGHIREVIWDDEKCTYKLKGLGDYFIDVASREWEVIGNAYENPDLAEIGMSAPGWTPENAGLIDPKTKELKRRSGEKVPTESVGSGKTEFLKVYSLDDAIANIKGNMDSFIAKQEKHIDGEGNYERNLGYIQACNDCLAYLGDIGKTYAELRTK